MVTITTTPPGIDAVQAVDGFDPDRPTAAGLAAVAATAAAAGATAVTMVAKPATDATDQAATGWTVTREVLQLRRALPLDTPSPATVTRPFRPGTDDARWLEVNARAFAWHPDQGDWTADDLAAQMAADWFDPDGFLVHDADDGTLDAFCWTKVHPATATEPALGEIFVIAVDPDAHRQGLGRAMVCAGLDHLAGRGLTTAMLYVESDNPAGRALYDTLGFTEHERHRWYRRTLQP
jgi:mycothiol synthase